MIGVVKSERRGLIDGNRARVRSWIGVVAGMEGASVKSKLAAIDVFQGHRTSIASAISPCRSFRRLLR